MRMKAQCKELVVFAVIPWMGCVQAWGGGVSPLSFALKNVQISGVFMVRV